MSFDETSPDPWELGWEAGFTDDLPESPFLDGSDDDLSWKRGYEAGKEDV